jgi:hypothetical protein
MGKARDEKVTLLSNASATGSGSKIHMGGVYEFEALGTFDGETVTVQKLGADASTYVPIKGASFTSDLQLAAYVAPGSTIRAFVSSGGGSPSGLYVTAVRCGDD